MVEDYILPDLLEKNLPLVICGTAVGEQSARVGLYYANSRNKFWKVLYDVGLTPVKLSPKKYRDLLRYGIGLIDVVKHKSGSDKSLSSRDYNVGVSVFKWKIKHYSPKVLCFNGKKAAKIILRKKKIKNYGYQNELIGSTKLFVAPSTSGAAERWWDISWWQKLADDINKLRVLSI